MWRHTSALEAVNEMPDWGDREVELAAVGDGLVLDEQGLMNGIASLASQDLQMNKDLWMALVQKDGMELQFFHEILQKDRDLVLAAVRENGMSLQYAHESLQKDRDVVLAAVEQTGPALKFAGGGLNQDPECLKVSGLWDKQEDASYARIEEVIQSVKFSLAKESSTYATDFALAMKKDPFLMLFKTYNPNAWCKESCDPDFTNIKHPCRGTVTTCQNGLPNTNAEGKPCRTSCWRFAFRFHQQVSKDTKGFMIQLDEFEGLGGGQKIETLMAEEVGLKIFRTFTGRSNDPKNKPNGKALKKLANVIDEWYQMGCSDMRIENVYIGTGHASSTVKNMRPKYSEHGDPYESMVDAYKRRGLLIT